MIDIGSNNRLKVASKLDSGFMLSDGQKQVLLPKRLVQGDIKVGDPLEVFVYTDSEDRPVATMQTPLAKVGDFACLKVVDTSQHGVFLDWGLDKDLFVPHGEQHLPMEVGKSYVVAVYLDNVTDRVAAASKLAEFFDYDLSELKVGQEVDLFVYGFHSRGTSVIVDDRYSGLIYRDKNFKKLQLGERLKGYVDAIREDNKLDIRLSKASAKQGKAKITQGRDVVLNALKKAEGELPIGDKSSPEEVHEALGISKKAFKAAVGTLYKEGLVEPSPHSTKLVKS